MLIPLIKKNPEANDFTCRDGEVEFMTSVSLPTDGGESGGNPYEDISTIAANTGYGVRFALEEAADYPTATIRIPLQSGDKEKAALMLQGQIARVDAATADRLTKAIVEKAASAFYDIALARRRLGLYMLPFRVYSSVCRRDGSLGLPSAQAVMLPTTHPPHPEITGSSLSDDTLTLELRFTVRPHRLKVTAPPLLAAGCRLHTFISYPLYIPKAADTTGSLGSVRSATGGNTLGIRFQFLSESSLKYSVAAPDKYYKVAGNESTGWRTASKAAPPPDYSEYADIYGRVPPFPAESLQRTGGDADPLEWIADWEKTDGGVLPVDLPYIYRSVRDAAAVTPEGVDTDYIDTLTAATGMRHILLTRPMTFAESGTSRRKATAQAVAEMRIHGLGAGKHMAVLLGSDNGTKYQPLRRWNPAATRLLMSPPRLFRRLLLLSTAPLSFDLALEVNKIKN